MLLHRHELKVLTGRFGDRIFFANFLGDSFGFGLGLRHGNTRLKSPDDAPLHVVAVLNIVGNARGNPDARKLFHVRFRRKQQFKTWRQYAHDDWRWSKRGGNWKSLANYGSISTKALLEVLVAQNNHRRQGRWRGGICSRRSVSGGRRWRRRLRHSIRFLKVSTGDDRPAHHLKEVGRYRGSANSLRRSVQTRKSEAKRIDRHEIFETVFCAVAQVVKVGIRNGKVFDVPFL